MASVTEKDIRNAVTPPLDHDDVSSAEIELKIRLVESWVKYTYFEGGSIPTGGSEAVILIILSQLLSNNKLAQKYGTLSRERFEDYEYELAGVNQRTGEIQSSPTARKAGLRST